MGLRRRFGVGDTVCWDVAGYTFCGVVDRFTYGRGNGYRSLIVRFPADDYERYGQAIDARQAREEAAGWPSPPVEFPACWVYENLTDTDAGQPGWFEFILYTDMVRLADPEKLPSREQRDPLAIPAADLPGLTLRAATDQDAEQLAVVHRAQTVNAFHDLVGPSYWTSRDQAHFVDYYRRLLRPDTPVKRRAIAAEIDGQIVGMILFWMGEIWTFRVHPDHRGKGIGRELLRAALTELQGGRSRRTSLTVLNPSVRTDTFLRQAGFHRLDEHRDNRLDEHLRPGVPQPVAVSYCRALI